MPGSAVRGAGTAVVGRGVPGVWDRVGAGEGYTGYPARHAPGPIFSIYLALGPTHGQMKVILRFS